MAFEETNTKQFHSKFKKKGEKRYIQELRYMNGTQATQKKSNGISDMLRIMKHCNGFRQNLEKSSASDLLPHIIALTFH